MINNYLFRKIIALVRMGDYAHPGGEKAIQQVFSPIKKSPNREILDVGCGLGGTASYIQTSGWGKVTGIDINAKQLDYAKKTYPNVNFYFCDATKTDQLFKNKFQLIYLFNSFYAFDDQQDALYSLFKAATDSGTLIISDYLQQDNYYNSRIPHPIKLNNFESHAKATGWKIVKQQIINDRYQIWYKEFVAKIIEKRHEIIKLAGQEGYTYTHNAFTHILEAIEHASLGGIILVLECNKKRFQ